MNTQELLNKAIKLSNFIGINNVDDPERLEKHDEKHHRVVQLTEARNLYIENSGKVKAGLSGTLCFSGTDIHSFWSDGSKAFFVDGEILYQLLEDYTTVAIRTGMALGATVKYTVFNDRVYYANGFQAGYILNFQNYSFMDPAREFKAPLPIGKHIEKHTVNILIAVGNTLYISDPLSDYYDVRYGYRRFSDDITMIRSVGAGLYVGDSQVYFVRGAINEEFARSNAYPLPAIEGTDLTRQENEREFAIWTSEDGVCLGDDSGRVMNITKDRYLMGEHRRGAAFICKLEQEEYYINTLGG